MQRNILLVDDEASLRTTLSLGLMQHGFTPIPCENGLMALKKLETYIRNNIPPDIIIADIRLPDIDGIKLVKIIKFKYPNIPVIVITAYGEMVNSEEISTLNINAFMEKPFTADALSEECEKIFELDIKKEVPPVREAVKPQPVCSAYVLIKANSGCDIITLYQDLFNRENVLYCDATRGEYDIFLLLQAATPRELEKTVETRIRTLDGVETIEYLGVTVPVLDYATQEILLNAEKALAAEQESFGQTRDRKHRVCSYLLVELEHEKLDTIYPVLRLNDRIVYCDCTTGGYDLVLLVTGGDYNDIDRMVNSRILTIDGILRIKELPVVNLMEM
ncbi:MAG: response regulator [Spirochaetales bacterium]|nr:response regulator [Spirochaetales bacterium]